MSQPVPPSSDTPPVPGNTRRTLLKTAGLVALVGGGGAVVAACSSSTATPSGSASPSAGGSSAAPSTSDAPSPSESAGGPSSKEPATSAAVPSGPSVTKAEVPVGGGFIMADAAFVVTQPTRGTYKAFSKICTHQKCPVSKVVDKEIICNCHNSHFSISDGSVISGPARSPLPEAKTTVSGDKIIVSA